MDIPDKPESPGNTQLHANCIQLRGDVGIGLTEFCQDKEPQSGTSVMPSVLPPPLGIYHTSKLARPASEDLADLSFLFAHSPSHSQMLQAFSHGGQDEIVQGKDKLVNRPRHPGQSDVKRKLFPTSMDGNVDSSGKMTMETIDQSTHTHFACPESSGADLQEKGLKQGFGYVEVSETLSPSIYGKDDMIFDELNAYVKERSGVQGSGSVRRSPSTFVCRDLEISSDEAEQAELGETDALTSGKSRSFQSFSENSSPGVSKLNTLHLDADLTGRDVSDENRPIEKTMDRIITAMRRHRTSARSRETRRGHHQIHSNASRRGPSQQFISAKSDELLTKQLNQNSSLNRKTCTCKASGCIKRYCPCFASSGFCHPACACQNCKNTKYSSHTVGVARRSVLARDPRAFRKVFRAVGSNFCAKESVYRGCNCRKGCSKKYCVCRENSVMCGPACTCSGPHGCQNGKVDALCVENVHGGVQSHALASLKTGETNTRERGLTNIREDDDGKPVGLNVLEHDFASYLSREHAFSEREISRATASASSGARKLPCDAPYPVAHRKTVGKHCLTPTNIENERKRTRVEGTETGNLRL